MKYHIYQPTEWLNHLVETEPCPAQTGIYNALNSLFNPVSQRPALRPGIQISCLETRQGVSYMLKTPDRRYLELSERDYFLASRMDGNTSLTQLALAYHLTYKSFGFERILELSNRLKQMGFLVERPVGVYRQLKHNLETGQLTRLVRFIQRSFIYRPIPVPHLDRPFSWLYRSLGRLVFTRLFFWVSSVLIIAGLVAFLSEVATGRYFLLRQDQALGLSLIWLVMGYALAVLLHEGAHGLAVKHFGGEVYEGGLLILYGMPGFYVNTSDMWMYGRRARIITSWAGPHSSLLMGAICSLLLASFPANPLVQLWFPLAVVCYLGTVFNLNILLELDGYYILMDWLGIPRLRARAFEFLRQKFWLWLRRAGPFSKEEKILGWFGLLALIYTLLNTFYTLWSLQNHLSDLVSELFKQHDLFMRLGLGLVGVVAAVLFGSSLGLFIWQVGRWLATRIISLLLARERNLALVLAGGLGVWLNLPVLVGSGLAGWLQAGLLSLLTLAGLGLVWWPTLSGSVYTALRPLSLVLLGLNLAWLGQYWALPGELNHLSLVLAAMLLLVIAVRLARHFELANLPPATRGVMAGLGLASWLVGLPAAVWTNQQTGSLLVYLASGLLVGIGLATLALLYGAWTSPRPNRFRFGHAFLLLGQLIFVTGGLAQAYLGPENSQKVADGGLQVVWWLVASSMALYQLSYRRALELPVRQPAAEALNDQARLGRAGQFLLEVALEGVNTTFGVAAARQLGDGLNARAATLGWPLQVGADLKVRWLGQNHRYTLVETGRQWGRLLEDFWQSLQQNYGKAFAMSNLRRAVDGLHWEERELSEEYLLTWANLDGKSRLAQRHDTEQLLAGVPIFAECSPAELHSLAQTFSLSRYQPGQLIIRQGEVGDNFYVVKTGRVSVWQSQPGQPEQKVNSHERGGYFGEVALLKEAPRNATCKADTPVEILSLSRPDFNRLARRHFEMAERLLRRYRYLTMLQNIPLFKDTPLESLRALAGCLGCQEVAAGQTIFRQGETGECFYIIEAGQVEILLEEEAGQLRCLDQRGAGEFFGEIALLLDLPRTATVRTVTATRLLSLRRADFLNLLLNSQSLNDSLQRVASRRLLQHRSLPLA